MKILVVGSGAREHTLAWKLSQSPKVSSIFTAPGNAGTAALGRNLDVRAEEIEGLVKVANDNKIELVVVGPEVPLAAGIVDRFEEIGLPIFGPTRAAARIESSKVFSKELMQKYGIPCARSASFTSFKEATDYVKKQSPPLWIKADGLAAGKGAIFAETIPHALEILYSLMELQTLGPAGGSVVIEECMTGKEMSAFVFSDGEKFVPMANACDYKRIFDGNEGPNTGGMGSYTPPWFDTEELGRQVDEKIMEPVIRAMKAEGAPYKSVLYGGLMITDEGPKVIEFNARFGDPEAQVVLRRLKTDLLDIIQAVIEGDLGRVKVELSDEACVGVVMASGGYPDEYKTGFPVSGLDDLDEGIEVFHAGTRLDEAGRVLTSGGRVLTVTATGRTLAEAREKVYANLPRISFEGRYYRKDIALVTG